MNIKPITTDADHRNAIARIEQIWDAEPGTKEADELEELVTLVYAYEEVHYPIH